MHIYCGDILTGNTDNPTARYLAEDKGRIVFVGDRLPDQYATWPQTDLAGRALLPAFADTHIHFSAYAFFAARLDVSAICRMDQLAEELADHIRQARPKLVIGFGLSAQMLETGLLPDRHDLDHMVPDRPVYLVTYDGHGAVANSALIGLLPKKIRQMTGADLQRGRLTGRAFYAATNAVSARINPLGLFRNLLAGVDRLAGFGIGLIHAAEGVGFPRDADVDLLRFVTDGLAQPFQIRLFFQTRDIGKVVRRHLPRIGGCFETALDGCFGTADAALNVPYANRPQSRGHLTYSDDQLRPFIRKAHRAGLQIGLHAIGDAAFDQAARLLSEALNDDPRADHRHQIIHACLPTERGLETCARQGIGICVQPKFLDWPQEPMAYCEKLLGKRAAQLSPLKTMWNMGIRLSGGSDAPCTVPDPIEGMFAACNHPVAGQSLSVAQALALYTSRGAWAGFDDNCRGRLAEGHAADMVMLNTNPLRLAPHRLRELTVDTLILDGRPYQTDHSIAGTVYRGLKARIWKKPDRHHAA